MVETVGLSSHLLLMDGGFLFFRELAPAKWRAEFVVVLVFKGELRDDFLALRVSARE
jgi:hypothetical protein